MNCRLPSFPCLTESIHLQVPLRRLVPAIALMPGQVRSAGPAAPFEQDLITNLPALGKSGAAQVANPIPLIRISMSSMLKWLVRSRRTELGILQRAAVC